MGIKEFAKNNIPVFDGAMGTMLQKSGLRLGESPDVFNMTHPEAVREVHRAYLKAGADIITTNTFGANARKLKNSDYGAAEVVTAAVKLAKEAASEFNAYVALDIGPVGELLEPMGTLSFDDAYGLFKEQVVAGANAGADAIIIETMTDLYEAKCAVLAAKENCGLPVFCTMSFESGMRTFAGTGIPSMALTLEGLGVDFLGINCSVGPAEMNAMVKELVKWTNLPILIQPNAGLPSVINGETVFNVNPTDFVRGMVELARLGVSAVGGCCGTTPVFIRELAEAVKGMAPVKRPRVEISAVCSASKAVLIDGVRIIGERINPTGKKRFQNALREQNMDFVIGQAIEQVEAGADILDVNVGMPGIDEKAVMAGVIKSLQGVVSVPLQIDSSDADVLEAGLRVYNGKAIVNSVNGEAEVLDRVLPIVKKYGAAVVGLTLDKNGIPRTAAERYAVAERIVNAAAGYGIPKCDVFIDCLTLTAGAEQELAYETLNALSLVKSGLGVKTALGVSNISFGLPARETMNQVFLSLALAHGLDLPIINPNSRGMADAVYCFRLLNNTDAGGAEYINRFKNAEAEVKAVVPKDVAYCIQNGLKDDIKPAVESLLNVHEGTDIVNTVLIPALDAVGMQYENGDIFLPQLLQSAEAAKAAFEIIKKSLPSGKAEHRDKIVLATVKGDIHDIGKNIVKVILENYGFAVVDLGKDVDVAAVADAAVKHGACLVGLSALMTTTVESMERTIREIKSRSGEIMVMVGGAVLTEKYAIEIGADFYAKDAMAAVAVANRVFGRQA